MVDAVVGFEGRVADDQVDLGATERLDAACGIDLIGNEFDAVAGADAELSIRSRERHNYTNIDCGGLRRAGANNKRRSDEHGCYIRHRLSPAQNAILRDFSAPRHFFLPGFILSVRLRPRSIGRVRSTPRPWQFSD